MSKVDSGSLQGRWPISGFSICLLCGEHSACAAPVCAACNDDLPRLEFSCERCAAPLPSTGTCGACCLRAPAFDSAVAVFLYRYPINLLIRQLKYDSRLVWVRLLCCEFVRRLGRHPVPRPEVLVPVPQHWRKRLSRGFNQSLEIAREIGAHLRLPVDDRMLSRRRFDAPQTGLSATQRARNVLGAFMVANAVQVPRSAAIIDDVMTTGATANELARVLKAAGTKEVAIWSLARAPVDDSRAAIAPVRYRGSRRTARSVR